MTKQGLQILVTGGRPLEHTALMEKLREEGAIVSESTDFAAILQVSQNNKLDVLVLIEPLPYSGRLRQIVALLRSQNATTKLVILSTNEVPERVQVTLKAGADGYVHKDETVATILHAIDAVVQDDIWVSPKLIRALTAVPTQQAQPQVNLTEREHQLLFLMLDYVEENNISFPVLLDPETEVFAASIVDATPTKVLLSRDREILQVWRGWTTQSSHESSLGALRMVFHVQPEELPQHPE